MSRDGARIALDGGYAERSLPGLHNLSSLVKA